MRDTDSPGGSSIAAAHPEARGAFSTPTTLSYGVRPTSLGIAARPGDAFARSDWPFYPVLCIPAAVTKAPGAFGWATTGETTGRPRCTECAQPACGSPSVLLRWSGHRQAIHILIRCAPSKQYADATWLIWLTRRLTLIGQNPSARSVIRELLTNAVVNCVGPS